MIGLTKRSHVAPKMQHVAFCSSIVRFYWCRRKRIDSVCGVIWIPLCARDGSVIAWGRRGGGDFVASRCVDSVYGGPYKCQCVYGKIGWSIPARVISGRPYTIRHVRQARLKRHACHACLILYGSLTPDKNLIRHACQVSRHDGCMAVIMHASINRHQSSALPSRRILCDLPLKISFVY